MRIWRTFVVEKTHHFADQMIPIDLDDGVKVNYAKFADVLVKDKARFIFMDKEKYPSIEEQDKLSVYIREIAQTIYDAELRREDSLIQQSSQMQTAFSFASAALFMVASIVVNNKYPLSYGFLLLAFSSISIFLLLSLILAMKAQRREKRYDFSSIKETRETIQKSYETISTDAAKNLQYIYLIEKIQSDIRRTNDNKTVLIQWSMRLFYCSIGVSVFWFFMALYKMKGQIS